MFFYISIKYFLVFLFNATFLVFVVLVNDEHIVENLILGNCTLN